MRIDVIAKGFQASDDLVAYAEEKGGKLPRYFDGTQQITFTLGRHDKTRIDVECVVDVEKHKPFVARSSHDDAKAAIDAAVDRASRQLSDFKEKLKLGHR